MLGRSRSVGGNLDRRVPSRFDLRPERRQELSAASPRRCWERAPLGLPTAERPRRFSNGDAAARRMEGDAGAVSLRRRESGPAGTLALRFATEEEPGGKRRVAASPMGKSAAGFTNGGAATACFQRRRSGAAYGRGWWVGAVSLRRRESGPAGALALRFATEKEPGGKRCVAASLLGKGTAGFTNGEAATAFFQRRRSDAAYGRGCWGGLAP